MTRVDPKDLILALAGPWGNPSQREARKKSYCDLPPELVAIAERHDRSGVMIFRDQMQNALEGAPNKL